MDRPPAHRIQTVCMAASTSQDPAKAELVKLRFYVGLTVRETAQALGISEKTVKRHWLHARAWLFQEIQRQVQS
jgi:RNA polymerase sigma factor (sigma-70 family)